MTDLCEVLPDFDLKPYRHLTHSLEKNGVTVSDLITFEPIDIARRCPLPLGDLKVMIRAIVGALHDQIGLTVNQSKSTSSDLLRSSSIPSNTEKNIPKINEFVKTLDPIIDECLRGGFHTGHVSEIVGESAVGKTQFVLSLLLSCQLPPPEGLGKSAIYLSTEAPLNTTRLLQMLSTHPAYKNMAETDRPTLDRIHTLSTNGLEVQDHIIQHQLPLAVKRLNVGLIVMDSVAANFRAEHETGTARGLADRAAELTKLGHVLRTIARDNNIAVVVNNQVSDRFDDARTIQDRIRSSSPSMGSSPAVHKMPPPSSHNVARDERLSLDYQQRFFTGWGDTPTTMFEQLKTPALGLAWANQISARVVLKMESERVTRPIIDYTGGNLWRDSKKKRFISVVFAPWVAPTSKTIEYEIQAQGIVSVPEKSKLSDPHADLLDPSLWPDSLVEGTDEEFP